MSQDSNRSSSESVSDQANAWFARLQADDVSAEERRRFQNWYQAHPQHAEAYEKTRMLWRLLQIPAERVHSRIQTEKFASADTQISEPGRHTPFGSRISSFSIERGLADGLSPKVTKRLQSYSRRHRFAVVCCLSVLLMIAGWHLPTQFQDWRSDYHTAPGQQLDVSLEDGSRLTLNTDTALTINFSEQQRRIELLRGEAYFEVAPNKARPFIVAGGHADARAVGTVFSVTKQADDLRVSVNEGSVEVSADSASTLVHAAQQVDYRQGQIQEVLKVDSDEAFAWKRGQVVFSRQTLTHVLAEVNRYRHGRIVAINPALAERIVSGVFNIGDADSVVDALKATLHVHSVNVPGDLVLLY